MSTRFERDASPDGPVVKGFAGKAFRVGDRVVPGGLLLTPDAALDWDAPDLAALTPEALGPLLALDPPPEFLVLGTGPTMRRPPPAFVAALEARGIGVEPMDSRAAARAWGMLRGEGRQIAAALMPL